MAPWLGNHARPWLFVMVRLHSFFESWMIGDDLYRGIRVEDCLLHIFYVQVFPVTQCLGSRMSFSDLKLAL